MHSFYEPTLQCVNWRDELLSGVSSEYANRLTERLTDLDLKKGYVQANTWLRGNIERYQILSQLGSMKLCVGQEVERISKREDNKAAMRYLKGVKKRLRYCDEWIMDLSGDKLKTWANEKSRRFEMSYTALRHKHKNHVLMFVKKNATQARSLFDDWEEPEKVDAIIKRMVTPEWWIRQAKRQYRVIENIRRECGQVCHKESAYVSRWGIQRFRKQKQTNRAFLESFEAVNQFEQKFTLSELAEKSISNSYHCKAELMVRIKGCQFLAVENGHDCHFITLTCPSKYHAIHKENGYRNSKFYAFGRPSPRDANDHLKKVWADFGKACSNKDIKHYGIRTVEPHHDGTPHWHLILFTHPDQTQEMLSEFKKQAYKVDPEEAGAEKRRFDARKIDPAKGGAAAYIAKYIAKNIDGKNNRGECIGVDDESDIDFINSAERVQAWKSRHGIRQFQFFGSVSITVWREIRRLKSEIPKTFIDIYNAAKASDWKRFTVLMGGMGAGRNQVLKPFYESQEKNQFGELKKVVKGLVSLTAEYLATRLYEWTVQRVGSGSFDLSLEGAAKPFPSSRVNNSPPRKIVYLDGLYGEVC
ncbi:hypothetical protein CBF23_003270 [Marinomonas agarivorans]|nr:hypothetical protein CBF23_003270 [Marinomonas agarivorans]